MGSGIGGCPFELDEEHQPSLVGSTTDVEWCRIRERARMWAAGIGYAVGLGRELVMVMMVGRLLAKDASGPNVRAGTDLSLELLVGP